MKLQKIKESELAENGISALSSRPALPSLYSGRSLSAQELKEAFDKLPRLIASRFNALLDSLGLYKDDGAFDRFAEVLATGLNEGHSLADLIADIQSGVFSSYLSVDGVHTLSETLCALSERIDKTFDFGVREVGDGNVVTAIEEIDDTLFIHKDMSTEDFAVKSETELLRRSLDYLKTNLVESYEVTDLDARLTNLEEALKGNVFHYREKTGVGIGCSVPKDALPYAMIGHVGGRYVADFSDNVLPSDFLEISHTPSDTVGYGGSVWAEDGSLVFDGRGFYEAENLRIVLCDQPFESGIYRLEPLGNTGLEYVVSIIKDGKTQKKLTFRENAESRTFYMPIDADSLKVRISAIGYIGVATVTPVMRKQTIQSSSVHTIRSVGKNLVPPEVYDVKNWYKAEAAERVAFPLKLPEYGSYTVSVACDFAENNHYLYLQVSTDGGKNWVTDTSSGSHAYLLGTKTNYTPYTFTYKEGEMWRFWYYPSTAPASVFAQIRQIQVERGTEATAYEPYTETVHRIPEAVLTIPYYGGGLSDTVYNYADFANEQHYCRVALTAFKEGDETDPAIMTDGVYSTYTVDPPTVINTNGTLESIAFPEVTPGGALFFENDNEEPVAYSVTYQIALTEGEIV